jgi:hypothetical protein
MGDPFDSPLESERPAERAQTGFSENWLPFVDAYRAFRITPSKEVKGALEVVRETGVVEAIR